MTDSNLASLLEGRPFRVALAQINTTVGDLAGNTARIIADIERARAAGCDLISFPELAITGYPPEDLLFKPSFIADNLRCLDQIVQASVGLAVIVGFVDVGDDLFNAAAFIADGKLVDTYHKMYLPNYGVFDEDRYFQAGRSATICRYRGVNIGYNICEDIWFPSGPTEAQAYHGAHLIVNINASPYQRGKGNWRETMLATRANDNGVIVCYTNLVGGQDELVFDGNSLIFDERGNKLAEGSQFAEQLLIHDLDITSVFRARLHDPRQRKEKLMRSEFGMGEAKVQIITVPPSSRVGGGRAEAAVDKPPLPVVIAPTLYEPLGETYAALVLGLRDYTHKNGFQQVVLGLSGGIDSALVAVIAADALGAANVIAVSMPSRFSSEGSKSDAAILADNLGIRLLSVAVEQAFATTLETLAAAEEATRPGSSAEFGIGEENLQARIRSNILMTLSNKYGWLVLPAGNKSELATGYCTLGGVDMVGGFSVLKDVVKTLVFELCAYRNDLAGHDLIPAAILSKPPSAELRPDQKDSDSLPPYDILDPIIQAYAEEDRSTREIAQSYDRVVVERIVRMIDRAEYKRRQAPPGIKITPRAFGRDRRLPITNKYSR